MLYSPLAHINASGREARKLGSVFFSPWRQNQTLNNQECGFVYKTSVILEDTQRIQLVLLHQVVPGFMGLVQTNLKVFQGWP